MILIRHAHRADKGAWNELDSHLSDYGHQQAQKTADYVHSNLLSQLDPSQDIKILSSPWIWCL